MKKALIAGLLVLASGGSAWAKDPPELVVRKGQVVKVAPGAYAFGAVSDTPNSKAILTVDETNAGNAGFTVLRLTLVNKGTGLIGMSPEMVKTTGPKGEPLAVLTYGEMSKLVDKSFAGQKFRAGFGNFVVAMAAASAGTSTSYGSYNSTTTGPYGGSYSTSGSASVTTYNPYAAARAQDNANAYITANNAALKARMAEKADYAKTFSFAPGTVAAGEVAITPIPIQLPKSANAATVAINVGGDTHQFELGLLNDPKLKAGAPAPTDLVKWPTAVDLAGPEATSAGVNSWVSDHVELKGWTFAGYDNQGAYFADLTTLDRRPTGEMRMWMRAEYFLPTEALGLPVRSDRSLWELRCDTSKVRIVSFQAHALPNLSGPTISEDASEAEWFSPQPGSVTESFSAKLCGSSPKVAI